LCSPVIGFFVTVIARIWLVGTRSGRLTSARLDAGVEASGPHDFAVRVSAVRQRALDGSRETRPATRFRARRSPRPSHPAPYVRDDRETPLRGRETARVVCLIWAKPEGKSFCRQDWTGGIELIPRENFSSNEKPILRTGARRSGELDSTLQPNHTRQPHNLYE
jgi:hypothetical protein